MNLPPRIRSIIVVLTGLFFCAGCSYMGAAYLYGEKLTCWEAGQLPYFMLETNAHFQFPASASGVSRIAEASSSWCAMGVRFDMEPDELNQFLDTSRVKSLSKTAPADQFVQDRNYIAKPIGLNLAAMKSYLFGYVDKDYFHQQHIIVDTSDPKSYVVFVITEDGYLD